MKIDDCWVECDPGCEHGSLHCAYIHTLSDRRLHDPDDCPVETAYNEFMAGEGGGFVNSLIETVERRRWWAR